MSIKMNDSLNMWEVVRPDGLMVFKPSTMSADEALTEARDEYLMERS